MATKKTSFTRTFKFERATKNTYRFSEEEVSGEAPVIGTLYIQRFVFDGTEPGTITVTVKQE